MPLVPLSSSGLDIGRSLMFVESYYVETPCSACFARFTVSRFLWSAYTTTETATLSFFDIVTLCIVSVTLGICMVISLIIYPVMFTKTKEVRNNPDYNAETSDFEFSWTFGIACGTVFFLMGASIFFFIRVSEEEDAQPMKSVQDKSYYKVM